MLDFLKILFSSSDDKLKEAQEEVLNKRQETKDNLAKNLKEKLFFTDNEVSEVISIIDAGYKKIDETQKNVQYNDTYGLGSSLKFEMELLKVQNEIKEQVTNKIKEIMAEKVKRAKEHFGKS